MEVYSSLCALPPAPLAAGVEEWFVACWCNRILSLRAPHRQLQLATVVGGALRIPSLGWRIPVSSAGGKPETRMATTRTQSGAQAVVVGCAVMEVFAPSGCVAVYLGRAL